MPASLPRPLRLGLAAFSLFCALVLGSHTPARAQAPQAVAIAVGGDNLTRLLWNNPDGSAALWTLAADSSVTSQSTYGPFPGWSGKALAAAPGGASRILWTNTDGHVSLWNTADPTPVASCLIYGPVPGWSGAALAVGGNAVPRLLWDSTDGRTWLWNFADPYPDRTAVTYGPYNSWAGQAIAVGSDNKVRILWDNVNGQTSVWNQSDPYPESSCLISGPYPNWSGKALGVGPNNVARLLWTNTDGHISVWNLSDPNPVATCLIFPAPSGYTALALAVGADNLVRVLWSGANGSAQVWTIAADGTYTAATYYALLAPTVLTTVAAVNNQVSLSWSSVPGAVSYNVKRSTTNGSGYSTVANMTSTSYIDQGLTNGTTYYYVVTAVGGSTESAPSNQVAATPAAQAFGFLNVGNGSVLSGQVTLQVSMASRAYGNEANPVTLSVDGTVYDTGGDMQQSSGNAGANTFFVLATDALANGTHVLNVQDGSGNSSSVTVTFSNVLFNVNMPSMFDASGGDGLPSSAAITASLTSAQPWTVSVVTVDSASSIVQSFSGNSASINVSWNGKNSQGVEVPDDAYEIDISYGSKTRSVTKGEKTPNGASLPVLMRNLLAKNRNGDCFVIFDEDAFPSSPEVGDGKTNMLAYLKAIKLDLAPSQGNVWNKFSFFPHRAAEQNLTASEIQRIDNHFKTPLGVFYVDSHGGLGTPNNGGAPFFRFGGHSWRADTFSSPVSSGMATLTGLAGYGTYNPPALVFIDCCFSAGIYQSQPDLSFAYDFDIGNGSSGFIGWSEFAVEYGAKPAPLDDWTFWRLDLWNQFTNVNQTYDTARSKLLGDYSRHGHNAGNPNKFLPTDIVVFDWPGGSSF